MYIKASMIVTSNKNHFQLLVYGCPSHFIELPHWWMLEECQSRLQSLNLPKNILQLIKENHYAHILSSLKSKKLFYTSTFCKYICQRTHKWNTWYEYIIIKYLIYIYISMVHAFRILVKSELTWLDLYYY